MSAPSLMCRTKIFVIALVVLIAGGAHAAQGSAPVRVHHKTTTAAGVAATRHAASTHRKRHAAPAHSRTQIQARTTRKPTVHEAGRTAGLVIRRKLAQKRVARRNVVLHEERSHAAFRRESEGRFHVSHAAPPMELASTYSVFLPRPAEAQEPAAAEELERRESSARNLSRAVTHAQTRDEGMTNEEMDDAESEALHKNSLTPDAETPDAETPDDKTEEASLRVPLGAMPAPLRGSLASLERQNARLDAEGLERIEDESDLEDRIAHKLLVPIPVSSALTVNSELPETHRYCRPWTARFLADLAREHDAVFHRPLEVSSAVRTMEYQKRLMEINGNAAPAEGDIVSPHLTGATIDIAKDGLSRDEIAWMRRRLLALQTAGKIDVEEEFRQACFHITVYKTYVPPRTLSPATQAGSGSTGTKRHKTADPTAAAANQGL